MEKSRALELYNKHLRTTVGGWKICEYIGHGGSAVVLKATRDDISAALKIVDQEIIDKFGRDEQIKRVIRERVIIDHEHPNLIKIYDAGVCHRTGLLFVAMELHNSVNLSKVIPEFPPDRIFSVISQIASAAKFLESLKLVHRDIKPDNVIISNNYSNATLLDLGVLRPVSKLNDDITISTAFLGTTRYSSPEYLLRDGDEESVFGWRALTFYQLGGLLHDMIMRRRLFYLVDGPPARLIDAVRYATPEIQSEDVQCRLVSLAKNCLQKDWRLRLKLVSWNSFLEGFADLDFEATEARIAERISTEDHNEPPREGNCFYRSRRLELEHAKCEVSRLLANECTDTELFPPRRIDSEVDHETKTVLVVLRTEPSKKYALLKLLTIQFIVEVLDFGSMHVRISGFATLGPANIEPRSQQTKKVFVGKMCAPELSKSLRKFAVGALDAAQKQLVHGNSNELIVQC